MKFLYANRIAPDVMPHSLGLFCLPMSHKKDVRLIIMSKILSNSRSRFLFYISSLSCSKKASHLALHVCCSNTFVTFCGVIFFSCLVSGLEF